MKKRTLLLLLLIVLSVGQANAQRILTIEKAIELSFTGSPDLQKAALNLERYQELLNAQEASMKSQFSFNVTPASYQNSRNFDAVYSQWYTSESFSTSGTFSIEQPIVWTGTTISLNNKFGWQQSTSQITGQEATTNTAFSNSLYLSLSQPLFTYNSMKMELEEIEMDYENALISYALTRLSLEQSITEQFYSVYTSQNSLAIAIEELENDQQNYDIIVEKVNLDISPRSELFQAELNLATSKSSVESSMVSLETNKDNLKIALGLPLSEDIVVEADLGDITVYINLEKAIENALSTRLELRQREMTNKELEFSLITTKDNGKFQGSLSASIGIMGDDSQFTNIYESPTQSPSVMLTFSVPIFDWGERRSRIRAQELSIESGKIDTEQELIDIEKDIRQVCRNIQNQITQIEIAKQSLENAQLTYDLNVEKYRSGEINGMEMSEFQSQLSTQKSTLLSCYVNMKTQLLNLRIISLYDFEKDEPISPLSMYSVETYQEYEKYKKQQEEKKLK
ncbi:MAG: TolC family protein [Rikenellaceae bacterium]